MKIKYKSATSVALLLTTLTTSAETTNNGQQIYTIGVQNFVDFHPYSTFLDDNYSGFNRDLLDMFASSQGFIFDYKARPIKRLFSEFLNDFWDFKYPDNANWVSEAKRHKEIYYSQPVVEYIDGLMVKKENQGKAFSALKKISVINGFAPEKNYLLAKKSGQIEFISGTDYQRLLNLVTEDRVDGAYFDITITEYYIAHAHGKVNNLVFDDSLPFMKGTRRLSSLKHPEIIQLFDQFLIDYKVQIDTLKLQYGI